jgi:hypothetical protein
MRPAMFPRPPVRTSSCCLAPPPPTHPPTHPHTHLNLHHLHRSGAVAPCCRVLFCVAQRCLGLARQPAPLMGASLDRGQLLRKRAAGAPGWRLSSYRPHLAAASAAMQSTWRCSRRSAGARRREREGSASLPTPPHLLLELLRVLGQARIAVAGEGAVSFRRRLLRRPLPRRALVLAAAPRARGIVCLAQLGRARGAGTLLAQRNVFCLHARRSERAAAQLSPAAQDGPCISRSAARVRRPQPAAGDVFELDDVGSMYCVLDRRGDHRSACVAVSSLREPIQAPPTGPSVLNMHHVPTGGPAVDSPRSHSLRNETLTTTRTSAILTMISQHSPPPPRSPSWREARMRSHAATTSPAYASRLEPRARRALDLRPQASASLPPPPSSTSPLQRWLQAGSAARG